MLCAGHPAAASQGSATVLKGVQSNQKKLAHVWSQQDSASMHRQACIVCHAEMRFPLTQEAMLQLRLLGLVLLHNTHAHRGAHLLAATSASALLPCTQQGPGLPLRARSDLRRCAMFAGGPINNSTQRAARAYGHCDWHVRGHTGAALSSRWSLLGRLCACSHSTMMTMLHAQQDAQ